MRDEVPVPKKFSAVFPALNWASFVSLNFRTSTDFLPSGPSGLGLNCASTTSGVKAAHHWWLPGSCPKVMAKACLQFFYKVIVNSYPSWVEIGCSQLLSLLLCYQLCLSSSSKWAVQLLSGCVHRKLSKSDCYCR